MGQLLGGKRAGGIGMSLRPTVNMLHLAAFMSETDPKVVEVILERGAHFASRGVAC
jgi:hypothetical protein